MSLVTAHVLDAVTGTPAVGMRVGLRHGDGPGGAIAEAVTDSDGRVRDLGPDRLDPGSYLITFDTGGWFADRERPTFYPLVQVVITVADDPHYHIPLLLSPFAYSTYRGS